MKIVGNTVGTTMPRPNLMQTDPQKGDYVHGREEFLQQVPSGPGGGYVLTEADKQEIAEQAAGMVEVPEMEIPTNLPNPHALTFTGAVSATYDGREAVSVEIPLGGGGGGEVCDLLMDVTTTERIGMVEQTIDNVAYKQLFALAENVYGHTNNTTAGYFLRLFAINDLNQRAETRSWVTINQVTTPKCVKFIMLIADKTVFGESLANQGGPEDVTLGAQNVSWGACTWDSNKLSKVAFAQDSYTATNTMEVGARLRIWGVRA